MKLGLITDIHEHVDNLQIALKRLSDEQVDQVVVIGDVFLSGNRIDETCDLLRKAEAVGVWGNHDFGLSCRPTRQVRERFGPAVTEYMTSLRPRLELGDCHFTHVEPWLNAENPEDLWYFEGSPDKHRRLDRIFDAVTHRLIFVGHYHKWLLASAADFVSWRGECPISLRNGRYFVAVHALCRGAFAVFDTATGLLTPMSTDAGSGE